MPASASRLIPWSASRARAATRGEVPAACPPCAPTSSRPPRSRQSSAARRPRRAPCPSDRPGRFARQRFTSRSSEGGVSGCSVASAAGSAFRIAARSGSRRSSPRTPACPSPSRRAARRAPRGPCARRPPSPPLLGRHVLQRADDRPVAGQRAEPRRRRPRCPAGAACSPCPRSFARPKSSSFAAAPARPPSASASRCPA